MKQQAYRSYSRLSRLRSSIVVVPCVLLPLVLLGVPVVPAVELMHLNGELVDAQRRADRAADLGRALVAVDEDSSAESLRELSAALRELIPTALDPVEVHATSRVVAALTGVELNRVRMGTERPLGEVVAGEQLVGKELYIVGNADPRGIVSMVSGLRRCGLPLAVRAVGLRSGTQSNFAGTHDFELNLELFRRAEPVDFDSLELETIE